MSHRPYPIAFQCPQCLTRDIEHMTCDCEPRDESGRAPHEQGLVHVDDPCERAGCTVCGWMGTYPDIPTRTPADWQEDARAWQAFGAKPAEALFCCWLGLRLDGVNPMWSCHNAINKAGGTMIDLVATLVRANRLPQGEDPLDIVRQVCERLDRLERNGAA